MICNKCNNSPTKVTETGKHVHTVLRRRKCLGCGHTFSTKEEVSTSCGAVKPSRYSAEKMSREKKRVKANALTAVSNSLKYKPRKNRGFSEELSSYYSEEYVDSQVSDEEVEDLLALFN